MKVKDYMKTGPVTIGADKTLSDAVKKMVEEKTNSLIVVDPANSSKPVGIFNSLRLIKQVLPDYLEKDPSLSDHAIEGQLICFSVRKKDMPLSDIMFKLDGKLNIKLRPNDAMVKAASYASKRSIRTLPVVDENETLIGVIDRTCIKNAIHDSLFRADHSECEHTLCESNKADPESEEHGGN